MSSTRSRPRSRTGPSRSSAPATRPRCSSAPRSSSLCYAAVLGIVAVRRSLTVALAGVGLFALVGALASLGRGGGGWASPVPSIAAGLVAAGVMVLLTRRAIDAWPRDEAGARPILDDSIVSARWSTTPCLRPMVDDSVVSMNAMRAGSRRRFLGTAAAIGAAAVVAGGVGRWMADRATVTAERLGIRLPRPAQPLPPVPAGVQVDVAGVSPFITPNEDFYRIDTAIIVPSVDVGDLEARRQGHGRSAGQHHLRPNSWPGP